MVFIINFRGVAQLARALALGARSRRFKSCHPDQLKLFSNSEAVCLVIVI